MERIFYTTRWTYKQINDNYWIVTDAEEKEYYIFKRNRWNAYSGDFVEIKVHKLEDWNKKAEAIVSDIIKRTQEPIAWHFIRKKWQDFAFVRAYNTFAWKDIFVTSKHFFNANNWDIVLVQIISWKDKPSWKIIKIIWKDSDPEIVEKIILTQNNITKTFPEKVIQETNKLEDITKKQIPKNRLDLTWEIIVTIDWEDAKDLDDAISVKILANWNFELWVHIADVAEYIKQESFLDKEALNRWTSIYIPGSVIAMLPEKISNNLCSLNTDWTKATLSIVMQIDKNNWKVITKKIFESIIKSKARLTYNEVWNYIENQKNSTNINSSIWEMLNNAYNLFVILKKRRLNEGKIDFDLGEIKIEVDENKKPVNIYKLIRNDAHKLIEEFMITANEEISRFFSENKIPFLYRIHEKPSQESIQELVKILREYQIFLDEKNINPLVISQIISWLKWKKEEYLLNKKILQAMTKAKYSDKILWHFWLSLKYYSHFTSPIRRYPDLQIHRIIKEYLNKKLDTNKVSKYKKNLSRVAKITSNKEQIAEEIERKISFLKTIEYMQDKIWEKYEWTISWITNNWIYVELSSWVEWFIWAKSIQEKYYFNAESWEFVSKSKKEVLAIWNKINIKVTKADKIKWFLDFEIINKTQD